MTEKLIDRMRGFLAPIQGRDVDLTYLRKELRVDPKSPAWDEVRVNCWRLSQCDPPLLRPSGKKDGTYRVITQVKPVRVFGAERRPAYPLIFPRDRDSLDQIALSEMIDVREGDLILVAGVSNKGKTGLVMNLLSENLDKRPLLMGNEFTIFNEEGEWIPSPRFLDRLDAMSWVTWVNGDGAEKFDLLPVHGEYPMYIQRNRLNIIDWINIASGEHYLIGPLCERIKQSVGRGVAVVVIQKDEERKSGRGGQFTKDFTDCEILLDGYGDEILMTLGKVKAAKDKVYGRAFAYGLWNKGTEIRDFREVVPCLYCNGSGLKGGKRCEECDGKKYVDKKGV